MRADKDEMLMNSVIIEEDRYANLYGCVNVFSMFDFVIVYSPKYDTYTLKKNRYNRQDYINLSYSDLKQLLGEFRQKWKAEKVREELENSRWNINNPPPTNKVIATDNTSNTSIGISVMADWDGSIYTNTVADTQTLVTEADMKKALEEMMDEILKKQEAQKKEPK